MHSLPRSPAAVTDVAVAAVWPFPTLGCFFSMEKCAPSQPVVPSRCVSAKQSPPRASVSPLGTVPAGLGQQSRGWPSLKLHSWPPSTVVWPSPPRGRCKDRERGGRCQLPGCSGRRGRGRTRGPRGCAGWERDLAAAFGGSEGPPGGGGGGGGGGSAAAPSCQGLRRRPSAAVSHLRPPRLAPRGHRAPAPPERGARPNGARSCGSKRDGPGHRGDGGARRCRGGS